MTPILPPPNVVTVRDAEPRDGARICEIYNPYILNTTITFEEDPLTPRDILDRLSQVKASHLPWLVLEDPATGAVKGYCYAAPWKARAAYRYTVETSIYLDANDRSKGFGKRLYTELLQRLQSQNIHSAIGILALPNPHSIRLHEQLGFEYIGCVKEAGFKFDRWIDVVYWQRIFRS
jgi:L-amino acid N-acyltransferase YncA